MNLVCTLAALRGEYVSKRNPVAPNKPALDVQLAAELWVVSENLCAVAVARAAQPTKRLNARDLGDDDFDADGCNRSRADLPPRNPPGGLPPAE